MPRRPRRLWDQYEGKLQAELQRGTGWFPAQSGACRLEPPFDPYHPRRLNVWDCVVNEWEAPYLSGMIEQLLNGSEIVHHLGAPLILAEDAYGAGTGHEELVVLSVEQFAEDENTTMAVAEQLLRSLLAVERPVAFEIVGDGGQPEYDIENTRRLAAEGVPFSDALEQATTGWTEPFTAIQFTVRRQDAALLRQQLTAHYPNSAVVEGKVSPFALMQMELQGDERSIGGSLALEGAYVFPIRTFRQLAPDVLSTVIAAMENLSRNEWALLQILFAPARAPWDEVVLHAASNPYKADDSFLSSEHQREMKSKFASPLFAVSVRLASSRRDVFRGLVAWAEQFANPPCQRFLVNHSDWSEGGPTDDERSRLECACQLRYAYRPGMLLNTEELAGLVHLPGMSIASERLRRITQRTRAAKVRPTSRGDALIGENVHRGQSRPVSIPADVRSRHVYVTGTTGSGKSTLLLNMALADIAAGQGVGVLDPHGDLIADLLRRMPKHRLDDVIYFNPADAAFPPALNVLEARGRAERERVVTETVATVHHFWPEAWGPRLQHVLTYTLSTAVLIQGGTLRDVRRLLTDANYRRVVVAKLTDPDLLEFWSREFPELPKGSLDPILNKLSPFLLNSNVRNIVCQKESLFDFDAILAGRKVFLANLSFGLLTEPIAGTLGTFLMGKLLMATFRRAGIPRPARTPFHLYLDEFQNFLSLGRGFDQILSEARKFGLVLHLAHQYTAQLSPSVKQSIFGNAGTLIAFRLGIDDARLLAHDLRAFSAEELTALGVGQAIARVGDSSNVFNLAARPPPPEPSDDPTIRRPRSSPPAAGSTPGREPKSSRGFVLAPPLSNRLHRIRVRRNGLIQPRTNRRRPRRTILE
nr:type IV secretion system DNA-binding domain-containing protein [Planctomycetota bacterium]